LSKLIRVSAVVNALAVLTLGAARLDWPQGFWTNRAAFVFGALIVSGLVPLVQAGIAERGERARRKAIELEQKIEAFLVTSLIYVVRDGGADWENTGIQAFVVRSKWRPRQVRLAKVRLGAIPTSGIQWTQGKGVIGRC